MIDLKRTALGLAWILVLVVSVSPCWADASGDTIGRQQAALSDTDFYRWLQEYRPADTEQRETRWKMLADSNRTSLRERLKIYEKWSEASGSLPRPVDQVTLALQSKNDTLARSWLELWWDEPSSQKQQNQSMADALVEAGRLEWARETLMRARRQSGNNWQFFRRMAAIEQALGHPERALDQYLRAWVKFQYSSYLRVQALSLVERHGLDNTLIKKMSGLTGAGKKHKSLRKAVDHYFLENHKYDEFIRWVKTLYDDQKERVEQIVQRRNKLLSAGNLPAAEFLTRWLAGIEHYREDPFVQIELDLRSNRLDTAVRRLRSTDTELRSDTRYWHLRIEHALRARQFETIESWNILSGDTPVPQDLQTAYMRATHQYHRLIERLRASGDEQGLDIWLTEFRRGDNEDTLLRRMAGDKPDDTQLPLALALAGLDQPEPARKFLRKLDRYPLDSPVDTAPLVHLLDSSVPTPGVLLDRWFKRFPVDSISPEMMQDYGSRLEYPQLLLEAARYYQKDNRQGQAIRVLEELLINHPHTHLRNEAEELLHELS